MVIIHFVHYSLKSSHDFVVHTNQLALAHITIEEFFQRQQVLSPVSKPKDSFKISMLY